MIFLRIVRWIFLIVGGLVSLSFFTLTERKVLGYLQFRKGPNKIRAGGILQPFSDALKLISKQILWLRFRNYIFYLLRPFLRFLLILLMWSIFCYINNILDFNFSCVFFLCCLGFRVYSLMLSGWSSNSKFSYTGAIRGVAQSISYEVSLALIVLIPFFFSKALGFKELLDYQINYIFWWILFPILLIWILRILAEINRSPFDFAEGESELVSGFNVEYGGIIFGVIFIAEYISIVFLSLLTVCIFFGFSLNNIFFYTTTLFYLFFILWIRGSLPRFRYDFLIYVCWKGVLPLILMFMSYFLGVVFILNYDKFICILINFFKFYFKKQKFFASSIKIWVSYFANLQ
jgi:NADH-ubiquinone oxidoreductase chain 1